MKTDMLVVLEDGGMRLAQTGEFGAIPMSEATKIIGERSRAKNPAGGAPDPAPPRTDSPAVPGDAVLGEIFRRELWGDVAMQRLAEKRLDLYAICTMLSELIHYVARGSVGNEK